MPTTAKDTHAGHLSKGVCGLIPVIIVTTSAVAMPIYSPVPKAASASADAVTTAVSNKSQPKKRPINMAKPRGSKNCPVKKAIDNILKKSEKFKPKIIKNEKK